MGQNLKFNYSTKPAHSASLVLGEQVGAAEKILFFKEKNYSAPAARC